MELGLQNRATNGFEQFGARYIIMFLDLGFFLTRKTLWGWWVPFPGFWQGGIVQIAQLSHLHRNLNITGSDKTNLHVICIFFSFFFIAYFWGALLLPPGPGPGWLGGTPGVS